VSGRVRRGDEAGVVTVFVVALMAVFIALAGLVVDGGMLLDARRRAVNEAEAAARAGAQVLSPEAVRTGGNDVAVAGAESAVRRYVAANGHDARVAVAADAVEVTVSFPSRCSSWGHLAWCLPSCTAPPGSRRSGGSERDDDAASAVGAPTRRGRARRARRRRGRPATHPCSPGAALAGTMAVAR
jgi:uncharacterized membrane protein